MSALCMRCKKTTDVVVIGDWLPPWGLCPKCAADVDVDPNETTLEQV